MFGKHLQSNERGSAGLYLAIALLAAIVLIALFFILGALGLLAALMIIGGIVLAIFGPKPYALIVGGLLAAGGFGLMVFVYLSVGTGLGGLG
jgi:hypothetical protein